DNDEALKIERNAFNSVDNAPEEESGFHKVTLWICEHTSPCAANIHQLREDIAGGMDPDEARARGLIRTVIAFLPLEQPDDLVIEAEPATPFAPAAEPAPLGKGKLGPDPTVTEAKPEPPMQTSRPKDPPKPAGTTGKAESAGQRQQRQQPEQVQTGKQAPSGPLEGKQDYGVFDSRGNQITDIDSIEGDTLWEEKSAVNATNPNEWVKENITDKFEAYMKARDRLPGEYKNAKIGFRFTKIPTLEFFG